MESCGDLVYIGTGSGMGCYMGNLWSATRWTRVASSSSEEASETRIKNPDPAGWRSLFQQDYDRLLFSTPVRRLSDKTQVWPMEENDGVRTRLTHSHEVSNLARSIGSRIAHQQPELFDADLHREIQPILSAIGLAHDLGNPPFGHQGEAAIGKWFKGHQDWIFDQVKPGGEKLPVPVPPELRSEFASFDGNPQTMRLLTGLQTHREFAGLDLTAGTLAATLKYPIGARSLISDPRGYKKSGYFESEKAVVEWIRAEVGIGEGERHPLTWIMEACDDIAYSVLDVDDVMKKKIISPDDVLTILKHDKRSRGTEAVKKAQRAFDLVHEANRDAAVSRDIKIDYLRAYLIDELIEEASNNFIRSAETIMNFSHRKALMDDSPLCDALKAIARLHAFSNPAVLKMEVVGAAAIEDLMTFFWHSITSRKKAEDIASDRTTPSAKFGWALVSSNYIEQAKRSAEGSGDCAGMRYRELRLLTDMISGMTDTFAVKLWEQVKGLPR